MDTKILRSCQVWWAQKLSRYYFHIDYCQGRVNEAADTLSHFYQRNQLKPDELRAENTRILHKLQSSLTNASLLGFSTLVKLLPLHQILICKTYVLSQLRQFWAHVQNELANKGLYNVTIGEMRLRLAELQESDGEAQIIKEEGLKNGYEEVDGVLHYQ